MNTTEYNKDVRLWTSSARRKVKNEILKLVLNIGPGYEKFEAKTKAYHGEVNRIVFGMPYYMVFVHKGAGRGYGGKGFEKSSGAKRGKRIYHEFTRADGSKGTTNPLSLGKMGTGKRKPKPWFNPILERELPSLHGILIEHKLSVGIEKIQERLYKQAKID